MISSGSGEMARLVAEWDWAATPLGPPDGWPQSLRSIVGVLLSSRFSMWMGWGPELAFLYNDAYRRDTLGAKHPWALGRPAFEVWAEIWPDIGPRLESVLETGVATWDEGLLLFLERSGYREETYHTFSYSPLTDDDGRVAGILCVVVEETDRIISERRMATLRDLGTALTPASTEGEVFAAMEQCLGANLYTLPFTVAYLLDADGARAALAATAGVTSGEPVAPPIVDLGDADAPWPFRAALAGNEPVIVKDLADRFPVVPTGAWDDPPTRAVIVPLAEPGRRRPAGFLVAGLNPYRPEDGQLIAFARLVAGQLAAGIASARAHQAERRRAEELAELDRAKTVFFSEMNHELRTPLALILGPTEDALAAGTSSPDTVYVHKVVQRNALRLQKLVDGMLDFSRLEAGRMQADLRPIHLAGFTAALASQFGSAVERAGLALEIDCPLLPRPVRVDSDMWEKIVLNLLSNALKFTFEGTIAVGLTSGDGQVVLTVSDTGIGIPAGEIPRLFERFHRVPGARSRTIEGTGIGLALVRELVRLHRGRITVESTEGHGSTFRVGLPALVEDREVTPDEPPGVRRARGYVEEALRWLPDATGESGGQSAKLTGPGVSFDPDTRVVVVDDEADMRDYLRRILSAYWTVDVYANGAVALEAITAGAPQLVVTDVMMPGLDGFGLLSALRAHPATERMPVIMLSARAGEEATVEGLTHGADDYLVKPFSSRELVARVRTNLDLARLREAAIEAEHRVALTLQESLLPQSLPEIDGVDLAARYIAGGANVEVGGDWYDVVALADGTVALAVGDVVGRGVRAAATMGQLRNAARVLLLQGHPPGTALAELNRFVGTLGEPHFSTAVLGRLDLATGTLRFANAGHPPPLVLAPGGSTAYLEGGRSVPLGVLPDTSYEQSTVHLDAGSTLLLYTDGLVERRREDLDLGLARLAALAALAADCRLPTGGLIDTVLDGMSDGGWFDDVVILTARL